MSKLQRMGVLGVRVLGASVALSVLAFAANCGSTSDDNPPAGDTGTGTDAGTDTLTPPGDGGKETSGDTSKPETGSPDLPSTLIAEGVFEPLQSNGMTADDLFIAIDDKGNAVAIPVAGGSTPITITDGAKLTNVVVYGKTVFVWKSVNATTSVGTLVAWTKATGAKTLSTASILYEAAASDDGTLVVYSDNARTGGKVFDYSISKTDGTGVQKAVIPNVMEDSAKCAPQTGFAGAKALVAWCLSDTLVGDAGAEVGVDADLDVGTDAGAPTGVPATVSTIDASGAVTTLKTLAVPSFRTSKDQTKVSLLTQAGAFSVLTLGGAETPIATGVAFGGLFPEGDKAIYVDSAKALNVASVSATPAPKKLADGVTIFYNPIDAATNVIYGTKQDKTGNLSDMFLVPVAGGTAANIAKDANATIFGDEFTADKSLVTIYSPAVGTTGTLLAIDVAAPATPKTIATNSWVAYSPKGSMIVYNDNYVDSGDTTSGSSDIHIVDAKTGGPKLIAVQAGADFYLTKGKDKVVYATVDISVAKPGLYFTAVP